MKANGLNEVFFATILLGLNGYFIGTANGNEEEDFTVEEFPEDLMPPPIRDDFSIRDEMSQNNLIQDKDMPKFGEPLLNITIPVGREALLSCVVDNLQTYKIAWLRVDTQTILTIQTHVITKNHRMVVTHAEKRAWQLKIRDVKESDKGWYMCQINTDPMKSQIAYLDVVVPPDILDYPTSTDMVVKEGSNVTLKCSATGSPPPTITFRREDGGPIKLPAGNEVYSINGSSFSISRVDRLDMGAFLCIASNGIPPSVSKRVMLIVHFPPMVTIQNQLVGAPLGQNATLECTSEAFPKSINYWMRAIDKNDSIITSGNKYVQDVHENVYKVTMKLTIIDVDITDFGTYKCLAKNSLGETDGSIKLYSNWILIVVHFLKYIQLNELIVPNTDEHSWPSDKNGSLLFFIGVSALGSYVLYFGIGGFLHWYFYVRQRDQSHEWKCQPNKFLTPDVERHEILLGSFSLFVVSVLTGTISWYAANDGKYLTIYYHANEYGWIWFFLQIPLVFIYQDYMDYLTHRLYHYPFLYKYFHKLHHKYKQPTAFSVTAIHPIEMVHMQMVLASPIVLMPVHWILFYIILLYTYYHGIIDHSGITFKAQWWQPWQPDAIFHDNHHQYFHVNYGFNMFLWDKLHGTFRLKDRVYSEDIFYGKGKAISDVSPEVLAKDIAERKSENPHAYRGDYNENELTEQDLKLN